MEGVNPTTTTEGDDGVEVTMEDKPIAETPGLQDDSPTEEPKGEDAPAIVEDVKEVVAAPSSEEATTPVSLKDEVTVDVLNEPMPVTEVEAPQEPNPVQKALEEAAKNFQGALDQHVAPHVQNLQGVIGNHVEGLKKHGTRTLTEMGGHTQRGVESLQKQTNATLTGLGETTKRGLESTKGALDQHVAPHIESVKTITNQKLIETKAALDEHVTPHIEKAKKDTAENVQKLKIHTSRAIDEHVAPKIAETHSTLTRYGPYYSGTASSLTTSEEDFFALQMTEGTFRAFGQVVFCNNPVTGVLIWVAIMIASPLAGICAITCAIVVNMVAFVLGMDNAMIRKGLLASNAVLVGSGTATFLSFEYVGWLVAILVSIVAAPVTLLAYGYATNVLGSTPPLTFPFVGVMLFMLLSAKFWDSTAVFFANAVDVTEELSFFDALFSGLSGIFLVSGTFSGILIAIGMALCSKILAISALAGSLLGALGAMTLFSIPNTLINNGLAGFNVALTVAALFYYVVPSIPSTVLALFGAIITLGAQTAVQSFVSIWSLPYITLPSCLAVLVLFSLESEALFGTRNAWIKLVPIADLATPEEHIELFSTRTNNEETEGLKEDIENPPSSPSGNDTPDDGKKEESFGKQNDTMVATEETPLLEGKSEV